MRKWKTGKTLKKDWYILSKAQNQTWFLFQPGYFYKVILQYTFFKGMEYNLLDELLEGMQCQLISTAMNNQCHGWYEQNMPYYSIHILWRCLLHPEKVRNTSNPLKANDRPNWSIKSTQARVFGGNQQNGFFWVEDWCSRRLDKTGKKVCVYTIANLFMEARFCSHSSANSSSNITG